MDKPSESALASLLLTDRTLDRADKPLHSKEYWALRERVGDPARLLGMDTAELATATSMSREEVERLASLLDGATQLAFHLDRLHQSGLSALTPFDDDYPDRLVERLGHAAPPVLYAAGPTSLLGRQGISVVGSRNMSAEADEVARGAAEAAARADLTVISGGAKGVDQVAMVAGTRAGGSVIGILADALDRALKESETRRLISDGQLCLATPYKPSAGFSAGNAMGRNKLIYALSLRTLVVSSDLEKGGTWAGATEAIRRSFGEVMVWTGAGKGAGNDAIVAAGGVGIRDVEQLLAPETEHSVPTEPIQLTLEM